MTGTALEYATWFTKVSGHAPHPWQDRLGDAVECSDRLVRIPTGFGKTAGTVLPWLFRRVERQDLAWPTRLAFCLPMRTLVDQTRKEVEGWVRAANLARHVDIHVLMGGVEAAQWRISPERPAILIGTQDMLLSRALNRGYGSGRAAWPMEFGLLHQDCLWIFDEIQLQDVGLATSAQLAAFRAQDSGGAMTALRPAFSWWMSATLQPSWLETVDHAPRVPLLREQTIVIPSAERRDGIWSVKKAIQRIETSGLASPEAISKLLKASHAPGTLTLCIVNTVDRALGTFDALQKAFTVTSGVGTARKTVASTSAPDLKLVHSRFRGIERRGWAEGDGRFLHREASIPANGRIIVATQVVEAGVDVSAALLVTDLAPWPSLVQRFGRCARYADGGDGKILVVGGTPAKDKDALPYLRIALEPSEEHLTTLAQRGDASPRGVEEYEDSLTPAEKGALYPYAPLHVLRRRDLDQLFDTSADLSGADVDVSRYIRTGEERDLLVFWRQDARQRAGEAHPRPREISRDELCPVPVHAFREWLKHHRGAALVYDFIDGTWEAADPFRLVPGMQVLLDSGDGGYDPTRGWASESSVSVGEVARSPQANSVDEKLTDSDAADAEDELSRLTEWKSIAVHGRETGAWAAHLGRHLRLDAGLTRLLALAGRWHDAGKAHHVFQAAIRTEERPPPADQPLAKAPPGAWKAGGYRDAPGFRHELASTLALFELLRRMDPMHEALQGPFVALYKAIGATPDALDDADRVPRDHALGSELAALDAPSFNLVAWMVCTHHGKVRLGLSSTPKDLEHGQGAIHGVKAGDVLPSFSLPTPGAADENLPALSLSLAIAELGIGKRYGASWSERVLGLLSTQGPFRLAYLEALLRAADVRASRDGLPAALEITR